MGFRNVQSLVQAVCVSCILFPVCDFWRNQTQGSIVYTVLEKKIQTFTGDLIASGHSQIFIVFL